MKQILITGSSRGIGKAIAFELAQQGYTVIIHGRTHSEHTKNTCDEIKAAGHQARILTFDVSKRDETKQSLLDDIEQHGAYYGVVLNAGIAADNAFPALEDSDWDDVISTNLDGFYNVLKPIIMPIIRTRKPARIITLSSVSGLMGNRGQVNYSAAKAGIIGATKALAVELASRKITVNCVAPGLIDTEMTHGLAHDKALEMIPMKRIGTSKEVASLVSFLCSEPAAYITRQVISVNGGMF